MAAEHEGLCGSFDDLLVYVSGSESDDSTESSKETGFTAVPHKKGREAAEKVSRVVETEEESDEEMVESEGESEEERVSLGTGSTSQEKSTTENYVELLVGKGKGAAAIDSLLSSTPVDISKILESQDAILSKRRMFLGGPRRKKKKKTLKASTHSPSTEPITIKERWRWYLKSLNVDFFTSKEARMEETGRVAKGKTAYSGLVLTPENNENISHTYEIKYRTKQGLGQPTGSFDQLRTAAGQYARLYFTLTRRDPDDFYNRGRLLECITDISVCRALLGYFRIRGSHSTVASKSMHLRSLAHYAEA